MTVESIHSKAHARLATRRLAHNITDIHSESQRRLTVILGNSEILQRVDNAVTFFMAVIL